MRRTLLTLLLATMPAALGAQDEPAPAGANAPDATCAARSSTDGTARTSSVRRIAPRSARRRRCAATSSVLRGPLIIAGHVTGNVLVINADVLLRPTARIDGDLLVVGGDVDGLTTARVGGAMRIYRPSLAYREDGDRIVALNDDGKPTEENWWRRLEHRREGNWSEALRIVQAGPYNRVEGLPIQLGPAIQRLTPWGSVRFDGAAIMRTGTQLQRGSRDVGHSRAQRSAHRPRARHRHRRADLRRRRADRERGSCPISRSRWPRSSRAATTATTTSATAAWRLSRCTARATSASPARSATSAGRRARCRIRSRSSTRPRLAAESVGRRRTVSRRRPRAEVRHAHRSRRIRGRAGT